MHARKGWTRFGLAALAAALASTGAAQVEPTKTVAVDCAAGQSIAHALTLGDERKPIEVIVAGTCRESVAVGRSDVALRAAPGGGGIAGPDAALDVVVVTGSRVTIDGLAITGGRDGVYANAAAGLTLRNATVSSTGRTAVYLGSGSSAVLDGCSIQDNPRDGVAADSSSAIVLASLVTGNGRFGIVFTNNAAGRIGIDAHNVPSGSAVTLNASGGVMASLGGSVYVAMTDVSMNKSIGVGAIGAVVTLIGGNTISDTNGTGVNASRGGIVNIGDPSFGIATRNTITRNTMGVFAFMGSSLNILDAVLSANGQFGLGLSLKSQGQLASSTIQGNGEGIRLVFGSGLFVAQPNTTVSNSSGVGVRCTDGESSIVNTGFLVMSGNAGGDFATTPTPCTGF
jgi:parallel beta helix pectate lyase-like protein